jgi:hypothetical protein
MGHELSDLLAVALAVCAIANGGELKSRGSYNGGRNRGRAIARTRRTRPEGDHAGNRHRDAPDDGGCPLLGTGKAARSRASAPGKDGSAQIPDPVTGATRTATTAPSGSRRSGIRRFVAVTLNGASKYGGVVAAPVFQKVAARRCGSSVVPTSRPKSTSELPPVEEEMADVAAADLASRKIFQNLPAEETGNVVETERARHPTY